MIGCGIDEDFEDFEFPIRLSTLGDESKDALFTFNYLKESLNFATFTSPLFVCTDNEAKMKAAYDGRYEDEDFNFGGRVGCTEHALSICIEYVFEKNPDQALSDLLRQITSIQMRIYTTADRGQLNGSHSPFRKSRQQDLGVSFTHVLRALLAITRNIKKLPNQVLWTIFRRCRSCAKYSTY